MSERPRLAVRYANLIRERFPPATHVPMILAFTFANMAIGSRALGQAAEAKDAILTCLVVLLFFLRLRLFDELKDLEYDKTANPSRPLARGLVTPKELFRLTLFAALIEIALVLLFTPAAASAYFTALGFSLLMFKEFFIGKLIRPHITSYAVMHTFVSVLMGFMAAGISHDVPFTRLPGAVLAFGLVNWLLFNIFEFARKTFAASEERSGVETYSSKFSPKGAAALTGSQLLMVILAMLLLPRSLLPLEAYLVQAFLSLPLIGALLFYIAAGTARTARTYRALAGGYIVLTYASFALTVR